MGIYKVLLFASSLANGHDDDDNNDNDNNNDNNNNNNNNGHLKIAPFRQFTGKWP